MKQFLIVTILSVMLFSCSVEDKEGLYIELTEVSSVEMPTKYRVDSITRIPVKYIKPSSCYTFNNFYYNSIGNERTIAVLCSKTSNNNCIPNTIEETTAYFNFKPKNIGTYTFRFWIGTDPHEGIDQYIQHEIVVDH
jgi:hypothetical protein